MTSNAEQVRKEIDASYSDNKGLKQSSTLQKVVTYILSVTSGIVLIGALVVVIVAAMAIKLPELNYNYSASQVDIPSISSDNVCFSQPKLDDDETSNLSNDEEFGATKAPTVSTSLVAERGQTSMATFGGINSTVESGTVVKPNEALAGPEAGLTIGTSNIAGTQNFSNIFKATDVMPFGVNGIKENYTADGDLRGLAVSQCQQPQTDIWFLGGETSVQATTKLILANPSPAPAQVMITVWGDDTKGTLGDDGSLKYSASRYIGINGQSETSVNLSAGAAGQKILAVHIKASATPIAATIQTSRLEGLLPYGIEYVNQQIPAHEQIISGINYDANGGSNTSFLNIFAPATSTDVKVHAKFIPQDVSTKPVEKDFSLTKSYVGVEDLSFLTTGFWAVELSADTDIIANVQQTSLNAEGKRELLFSNPTVIGAQHLLTIADADFAIVHYLGTNPIKYSVIGYDSAGKTVHNSQIDLKPGELKVLPKASLSGATILSFAPPVDAKDPKIAASALWWQLDKLAQTTSIPLQTKSSIYDFKYLLK
ncbi:hypothetical protein FACS1894125_2160 [Actinomycetota bacterium]|nr:hypothetical protein FACS1894125_2160 [Actinomycetota bacterium]